MMDDENIIERNAYLEPVEHLLLKNENKWQQNGSQSNNQRCLYISELNYLT
jgi:hypothetical protein